MDIRIYGLVEDSIVDGPGYRFAIFTQGCPHACPGCHNPESHDFAGGRIMDTEEIVKRFDGNPLMDGITLSGGDPLCQPEACHALAKAAHDRGLTVWCYTGYTLEALQKEADPSRLILLSEIDVLIDGPFLQAEKSLALQYCGSRNQRLIDMPRTLAAGKIVLWEQPGWDVL